jgi:hypothetical protein
MKKIMSFLIVVLSVLPFTLDASDEYPYGFPARGLATQDMITVEQVRNIALAEAMDAWGEVTRGAEIPCCDLYGNVNAYICVFKIGRGSFESYGKMFKTVLEGRRLYKEAKKNSNYDSRLTGGVADVNALSGELKKNYAKFTEGKNKKWGIGSYGTVVVSARTDFFPIAERIHGLPPFYTILDLMAGKCNGKNPLLTRIFYITPLDQYYEFEVNGAKVLINALSLKTEMPESINAEFVRTAGINDPKQAEKVKVLIKEAWKKYGL